MNPNESPQQQSPLSPSPTPSNVQQPEQIIAKKSMMRLWIAIGVFVMLIIAGSLYFFVFKKKDEPKLSANAAQAQSSDDTKTKADDATKLTINSKCLVQDDYNYKNNKKSSVNYDTTYAPGKTINYTGGMFFEPDTTKETSLSDIYDNWAEFATKNSGKTWVFRLQGFVFDRDKNSVSSKKLAVDRQQKVKSELIKRNVPENRIIIDPVAASNNDPQDVSIALIYRRVDVVIDPTCN